MMIVCLLLVSCMLLMDVSLAAPVSSANFNVTAMKQSEELEEGLLTQLFSLEGELETLEEEVLTKLEANDIGDTHRTGGKIRDEKKNDDNEKQSLSGRHNVLCLRCTIANGEPLDLKTS